MSFPRPFDGASVSGEGVGGIEMSGALLRAGDAAKQGKYPIEESGYNEQ